MTAYDIQAEIDTHTGCRLDLNPVLSLLPAKATTQAAFHPYFFFSFFFFLVVGSVYWIFRVAVDCEPNSLAVSNVHVYIRLVIVSVTKRKKNGKLIINLFVPPPTHNGKMRDRFSGLAL